MAPALDDAAPATQVTTATILSELEPPKPVPPRFISIGVARKRLPRANHSPSRQKNFAKSRSLFLALSSRRAWSHGLLGQDFATQLYSSIVEKMGLGSRANVPLDVNRTPKSTGGTSSGQDENESESLSKTHMGRLELSLSRNAQVFLDGKYVGDATTDAPFALELSGSRPHKLRFKNEALGLDSTSDFIVEKGWSYAES